MREWDPQHMFKADSGQRDMLQVDLEAKFPLDGSLVLALGSRLLPLSICLTLGTADCTSPEEFKTH